MWNTDIFNFDFYLDFFILKSLHITGLKEVEDVFVVIC